MSTPKTEVAAMLEALPESSSFEDIQYHLYVLEKVNRGLERAATEGVVSHEDAKTRLGKWLSAQVGRRKQSRISNRSLHILSGIRHGMPRRLPQR